MWAHYVFKCQQLSMYNIVSYIFTLYIYFGIYTNNACRKIVFLYINISICRYLCIYLYIITLYFWTLPNYSHRNIIFSIVCCSSIQMDIVIIYIYIYILTSYIYIYIYINATCLPALCMTII